MADPESSRESYLCSSRQADLTGHLLFWHHHIYKLCKRKEDRNHNRKITERNPSREYLWKVIIWVSKGLCTASTTSSKPQLTATLRTKLSPPSPQKKQDKQSKNKTCTVSGKERNCTFWLPSSQEACSPCKFFITSLGQSPVACTGRQSISNDQPSLFTAVHLLIVTYESDVKKCHRENQVVVIKPYLADRGSAYKRVGHHLKHSLLLGWGVQLEAIKCKGDKKAGVYLLGFYFTLAFHHAGYYLLVIILTNSANFKETSLQCHQVTMHVQDQ